MQENGFIPSAGQNRDMKKQHPARLQGTSPFHPLGEQDTFADYKTILIQK
jgi:hypothetical protein